MASFGYYALTALESIPAIVGIRSSYEQPRYEVLDTLGPKTEVRRYEARVAIEAPMPEDAGRRGQQEAFEKLFRYITGANHAGTAIAMTTPVEQEKRSGQDIAMTVPVEQPGTGSGGMRFFLPRDVGAAGAPAPNDPTLHIIDVPARTLAAIRYSGVPDQAANAANQRTLSARIAASKWVEAGPAITFNYDPPFTIPPFRRNEVLIPVAAKP